MALRNQPYFPLYVQDYLTDEKLNECSASTQGVYVKIMCLMHKSNDYGVILLKQKDKQTSIQSSNFALKLVKHLPFTETEIEKAVEELIEEGVLILEGDKLIQKRMVKDNDVSVKRSKAGKKGGDSTHKKEDFAKAKVKASSENEYEYESEDVNAFNSKVKTEILNSVSWIEQICMKKKKEVDEIKMFLKTFLDDLELKEELDKPIQDIKQHFINWLNIELRKEKKEPSKKPIISNR